MHQCPNFSLTLQIYNGSVELDLVGIVFKFYLYILTKVLGCVSSNLVLQKGGQNFAAPHPFQDHKITLKLGVKTKTKNSLLSSLCTR